MNVSLSPGGLRVLSPSYSDCSPSDSSVGVPLLASSLGAIRTGSSSSLPYHSSNTAADRQPRAKEECFSLEGYLSMKSLSGALASLLQSRKRLYFGLEEMDNHLVYYRSKMDFDTRNDCLGHISMEGAFCSLVEGNVRAFLLHTNNGKKYQLEADNDRAADCWLNVLRQRRENASRVNGEREGLLVALNGLGRHRRRSRFTGDSDSEVESDHVELQRQLARSHLHPKRRNLPPLRLDLLNGSALIGLENASASTPPTPKSLPLFRQHNNEKMLLRKASILGKTAPAPQSDGAGCFMCGARTATKEWVLNTWLKGQKHNAADGGKERCRLGTTSSEETSHEGAWPVTENGHGATIDAGSPESMSSNRPSTSPPATEQLAVPSSPSSVTCESAGAYHVPDELMILRELSNRQKMQIVELNEELERMKAVAGRVAEGTPIEHSFAAQNRFLNSELLRINERKLESDRQTDEYKRQIVKLEAEMEDFKKEYVHLLQSCVRIPIRDNSSCDVVQIKLFGGDEHEKRVKKLLEKARELNPALPTFESVVRSSSFHVDEYGFRHSFDETPLAVHFIATQLHQHYQSRSSDHAQLKAKWRVLLREQPERIKRSRDVRLLCRRGIPRSLRPRVWRLLINQQFARHASGKALQLRASEAGELGLAENDARQRALHVRLLQGRHPSAGMNFLVATALLFMGPEDAFWFLVAITERYFDSSYFDQSLTGAQADQEVLKEIVEQKFPRLAQHLDECEIDLTTVTLNWFIALFFDAIPFQTMLHLWDCFLYEGPKVLFRFTIALLGFHEEELLAHSDTISVIKVLKAAVRLTFDVNGLIKFAFEELSPFPGKAYLRQRQLLYLRVLQEQLFKRQKLRQLLNITNSTALSDQLCNLPIEVVVFSQFVPGRGYLHEETATLNTLDLEFDCRLISMVVFQPEMAFVSLLSGYIVALHLNDSGEAEILWELKLNDVALKLVNCSQRLYSCLANGTLAVLENAFERMPSALDLYHIPIAAAPITDALLDKDHLYLAVACKIVVLNQSTLSTVASVYVASASVGSQVPMFEKICNLAPSPFGIWLLTAHSSLIQLWRDGQCEMLFDIRYDHSHRKPSFNENDEKMEQVELCSILFHSDELWVGTVDGYLMLYRVLAEPPSNFKPTKFRPPEGRFQPGKRLSAAHGLAQPVPKSKLQTYYIPTENETKAEEHSSSMELETERQMMSAEGVGGVRRISVVIDPLSRKYSVNVFHLSVDSAHNGTYSTGNSTNSAPIPPFRAVSNSFPPKSYRMSSSPLSKPSDRQKRMRALSFHNRNCKFSNLSLDLENDEIFETCSDEGDKKLEEGRTIISTDPKEEEKRRRFPSRLVRLRSWRKLSSMPNSIDNEPSEMVGEIQITAEESGADGYGGGAVEGVRIKRKDLNFEEPLLLAVKEGDDINRSLGTSPSSRRPSLSSNMDPDEPNELETTEINSSLGMTLQMKLKVSDKPLRCISLGHFQGQDVVITGAGEYGDDEAFLRWRRDPKNVT
uniref:TBC1 domain family member 2B n=1 Tax=Globodera rostochiensis TaxID=31243 RepID=A0A914IDW9_GLORO